MKKILCVISCLLFSVCSVDALSINEDGSRINALGATITEEQYNVLSEEYSDRNIDNMDQKIIDVITSPTATKHSDKTYMITTYELDFRGNVVDKVSMIATKEQAEAVAQNDKLRVMPNGTLQDMTNVPEIQTYGYVNSNYYSTESKWVAIDYWKESDYVIKLTAGWYSLPRYRDYDIMAVRWNNSATVDAFYGVQESDADYTTYSLDGTNMKRTNYGLGVSMNLHNDATDYIELEMMVYSPNYFGANIFGTYQHANTSNTNLAASKSYSFGSSGLGGVLVFSNSTYASFYDGMNGVKYQG